MILLGVACFAAADLGYRFSVSIGGATYPVVWAPVGILAAAFLLRERRLWPPMSAVFVAATLVAGIGVHGRPVTAELSSVLVSLAQAWLTAALVQRTVAGGFTLARVSHVASFALWGLVTTAAAALAATVLLGAAGSIAAWRGHAMGDLLGLLLVTPAAVAVTQGPTAFSGGGSRARQLETVAAIVASIALMHAIYGEAAPAVMRVPAYVVPLILWAAFRCEAGDMAIGMLVVCAVGLWHTHEGRGPYTMLGGANGILRAQGAGAIMSSSILLLAAVVAERARAAAERDRVVAELQQALAEIKTLQGLIPLCAWCHKIRDDAGSWQGLESYLQQHTDATFSHGICPACTRRFEEDQFELEESAGGVGGDGGHGVHTEPRS